MAQKAQLALNIYYGLVIYLALVVPQWPILYFAIVAAKYIIVSTSGTNGTTSSKY